MLPTELHLFRVGLFDFFVGDGVHVQREVHLEVVVVAQNLLIVASFLHDSLLQTDHASATALLIADRDRRRALILRHLGSIDRAIRRFLRLLRHCGQWLRQSDVA